MIYNKCKIKKNNDENFYFHPIFGDGLCDKHGRFVFYRKCDAYCKKCHKEKCEEQNICEKCGKKL